MFQIFELTERIIVGYECENALFRFVIFRIGAAVAAPIDRFKQLLQQYVVDFFQILIRQIDFHDFKKSFSQSFHIYKIKTRLKVNYFIQNFQNIHTLYEKKTQKFNYKYMRKRERERKKKQTFNYVFVIHNMFLFYCA